MHAVTINDVDKRLRFEGADLEVQANLSETGTLTVRIVKSGSCVHQIEVDDASDPLEHGWIANLFAREDRVALATLSHQADDYLKGLDVNQG